MKHLTISKVVTRDICVHGHRDCGHVRPEFATFSYRDGVSEEHGLSLAEVISMYKIFVDENPASLVHIYNLTPCEIRLMTAKYRPENGETGNNVKID